MATPFLDVYDAFLARISADDWTLEEELVIVERDWQELLKMAIARFKYPRVSLEFECIEGEDYRGLPCFAFKNTLTNAEIQLLALYMKHEWVKRCIASWDQISMLYASKDFSQANHLDKLLKLNDSLKSEINEAQGVYDRARNGSPAEIFRHLAGKKNV